MLPLLIGVSTGILAVVLINILSRKNRLIYYGLILTGIGFLYVGYTWTDLPQLIATIIQAFAFMVCAYYGITRNINFLILGYFLHGVWDFLYDYFTTQQLIPPHYDIFCLAVDFTMGAYLLVYRNRFARST